MPVSKQARNRQERQKERLAAEAARRQAQRQRRLRTGVIGVAVLLVLGISVAAVSAGDNGGDKKSATTTTVAAATVSKPCVGLKDTLPKGAPDVPIKVGPAPTTLYTQDLKVGTGATISEASTITANYIGVSCADGKIFDSSYKSGAPSPVQFPLNGVIKGWTQGIPGMKVGGIRVLGIPADLAYGDNPQDGSPAGALWFTVEVVSSP